VLALSDKRNLHGYKVVFWANPERCNRCGICFLMCPEVVFVREDFFEG